MNKILYGIFAVILSSIPRFARAIAGATNPSGFTVPADGTGGLTNATAFDVIANFMNWTLGIIGVLAVTVFVISGILYLTSVGDEDQAKKAKTTMVFAIIGLSVAFLGLIIVNTIAGLTGAGGSATCLFGICIGNFNY